MTPIWPFAPCITLLWATWYSGGITLSRAPIWVVYALRFVLLEPLRLVERLVFGRAIRRQEPEQQPIFVLGHWRSGTSFLQELLALAPRFTTSTIYRSLFSDVFLLTERWLKPVLNRLCRITRLQFSIQRIPMNLDAPAEADRGLCCLGSRYSYTWGHVFPTSFGHWLQKLVFSPSPTAVAGWLDAIDHFQRKLSLASGGERVVLKSPGNTARLQLLAERYPQAQFIYIHREPEAVFHSNRYLWEVVLREHGVQTLGPDQVDTMIIEQYRALLQAYQSQRSTLPEARLVEVAYADLRDDPVGTLRSVYGQLGRGRVPAQEISDFVRTAGAYKAQTYATSPALQARLQREWGKVNPAISSPTER